MTLLEAHEIIFWSASKSKVWSVAKCFLVYLSVFSSLRLLASPSIGISTIILLVSHKVTTLGYRPFPRQGLVLTSRELVYGRHRRTFLPSAELEYGVKETESGSSAETAGCLSLHAKYLILRKTLAVKIGSCTFTIKNNDIKNAVQHAGTACVSSYSTAA